MSQREIERLIGRLITDEDFREQFEVDPHGLLRSLVEHGYELTPAETAALVATAMSVWKRVADEIDPRLQKVSLRSGSAGPRDDRQ